MRKEGRLLNELLLLLHERAGSFVSNGTLAKKLAVTALEVQELVQRLISCGYRIEIVPDLGYRYVEIDGIVSPEKIVPHLETKWLGREYHHYLEISSTNDEALKLGREGASHGTLVLAEFQTAGRGRLSRRWESPPGLGLTFSIILRPESPPRDAPKFTLVVALALTRFLRETYKVPARIKWPNDVLIGTKKVAGILAEMEHYGSGSYCLVIGIGLNVNHEFRDMKRSFRYPATSLAMELGYRVSRARCLRNLLVYLEKYLDKFLDKGFSVFLEELTKLSFILGKTVEIHCSNDEIFQGYVLGFTDDGALKLGVKDKPSPFLIWAGDVTRVYLED